MKKIIVGLLAIIGSLATIGLFIYLTILALNSIESFRVLDLGAKGMSVMIIYMFMAVLAWGAYTVGECILDKNCGDVPSTYIRRGYAPTIDREDTEPPTEEGDEE